MTPPKTKDVPQFLTIPNDKYATGDIQFKVNGEVKAIINNLELAREIMNAVACGLLEKYYPKHHFVISLCRGDDVLDTVIL